MLKQKIFIKIIVSDLSIYKIAIIKTQQIRTLDYIRIVRNYVLRHLKLKLFVSWFPTSNISIISFAT